MRARLHVNRAHLRQCCGINTTSSRGRSSSAPSRRHLAVAHPLRTINTIVGPRLRAHTSGTLSQPETGLLVFRLSTCGGRGSYLRGLRRISSRQYELGTSPRLVMPLPALARLLKHLKKQGGKRGSQGRAGVQLRHHQKTRCRYAQFKLHQDVWLSIPQLQQPL